MTTLTLRNTKGSPLTNTELDANFSNLNTTKAETASPTFTGTISAATITATGVVTGSSFSGAGTGLTGTAASLSIGGNAATVTGVTSTQVTTALGFTPYNSTNPSGYITSSGNAATATTLQTARTINGTSFNGSINIETTEWYHSGRDFINGTLITTSIDYSVANGDPFILEIKGNSYSAAVPFDIQLQGYIYSSTIINISAYSIGPTFNITAMNVGGVLCFWFPRISYWQGFNVRAYTAHGTRAINKVVSITDVVNPAGTKQVVFSPVQVLHSSNYNLYAPTLIGTGASGTWAIAITGNAATITSQANSATITASTAATANQIVLRDANGDDYRRYGYSSYLNMSHAVNTAATTDTIFYSSTDDFIRKTNATSFRTSLNVPTRTGGDASGTWGISISGSAATLTTGQTIALTGDVTYTSGSFNGSASVTGIATLANSGVTAGTYRSVTVDAKGRVTTGTNPTTVSAYGITNALVRGGPIGNIDFNAQRTLASGIYSVDASPTNGPPASAYSNFIQMYERNDTAAQLVIEYSSGRMYSRGIQTAVPTYSAWRTQLDDGNYNSYTPTLTGTGASGTWAINVTGNAATVTNGVYTSGDAAITSGKKIFYSENNTFINTTASNDTTLAVFQQTAGADAYMSFHISGDYAAYFGLGGAENDLVYGGWSAGATRHRILHSGNYTAYTISPSISTNFTAPQRPALGTETAPTTNSLTWNLTTTSIVRINLNANITTLTLTGTLSTYAGYQYQAIVRYSGGTAITWPATVKFSGGTAPTLTGTSGKVDIFNFVVASNDGGTTFYLLCTGYSQNL